MARSERFFLLGVVQSNNVVVFSFFMSCSTVLLLNLSNLLSLFNNFL